MYLLFSSDAYDLYRRDIISSLSLPENYSTHFRYPKNLLPQDVSFIQTMKNKDGMIVYASGNDVSININNRVLDFLPIRNVTIIDVKDSEATGLVHIFLKLGSFIDCPDLKGKLGTLESSIPPYKFIYFYENLGGTFVCKWHDKIRQLIKFDSNFTNKLFYNLDIRSQDKSDNSPVLIEYDFAEKCSAFKLTEDKHYTLELAIYNSSESPEQYEEHSIKLEYDSENFFITNPESIVIGADKDDRSYKIVTKDIKSNKSSSYIKIQSLFQPATEEEKEIINCEEVIRLDIKRSAYKLWIQFILSLFSFSGPVSGAYGVSQLKPDGHLAGLFITIALVCFVIVSFGQFYVFRKN